MLVKGSTLLYASKRQTCQSCFCESVFVEYRMAYYFVECACGCVCLFVCLSLIYFSLPPSLSLSVSCLYVDCFLSCCLVPLVSLSLYLSLSPLISLSICLSISLPPLSSLPPLARFVPSSRYRQPQPSTTM